jgi:hypothetical protein
MVKERKDSNTLFPNFARELELHPGGYHRTYGRVGLSQAMDWFAKRSINCPQPYLDFLSEIGPGSYFSGGLVLFDVEPGGVLDRATGKLSDAVSADFFACGYDGSTEGCYCLRRNGADSVYWFNWQTGHTQLEQESFRAWIEEAPGKLFNKTVYAGYKRIKDIAGIFRVVEERKRYQIRLLQADKTLVRPPGHEKDLLPRYNRLVCGVRKLEESQLRQLTFTVCRIGSPVGNDNVQYVTAVLPEIVPGEEVKVETYAFDPFNVPFEEIVINYSPEIDLGSPMRVRFAEIKDYL